MELVSPRERSQKETGPNFLILVKVQDFPVHPLNKQTNKQTKLKSFYTWGPRELSDGPFVGTPILSQKPGCEYYLR